MWRIGVARLISYLLGVEVWLLILFLAVIFKTGLSFSQISILFPSLLFFEVLVPIITLHFFIKTKRVADWDLTDRKDRNKLLLPILISWLLGLLCVYLLGNTKILDLFIITYCLAGILALITHFWKISLHVSMCTFGAILINYLFNGKLPELYLLIPVVVWARYKLAKHTLAQLILGFIVTGTISLLGLYLFRLNLS